MRPPAPPERKESEPAPGCRMQAASTGLPAPQAGLLRCSAGSALPFCPLPIVRPGRRKIGSEPSGMERPAGRSTKEITRKTSPKLARLPETGGSRRDRTARHATSGRASFASARMPAAAPAAADVRHVGLERGLAKVHAIPPKLVAKIQDPDLFKRPARTAERDAFGYSLPGLPAGADGGDRGAARLHRHPSGRPAFDLSDPHQLLDRLLVKRGCRRRSASCCGCPIGFWPPRLWHGTAVLRTSRVVQHRRGGVWRLLRLRQRRMADV